LNKYIAAVQPLVNFIKEIVQVRQIFDTSQTVRPPIGERFDPKWTGLMKFSTGKKAVLGTAIMAMVCAAITLSSGAVRGASAVYKRLQLFAEVLAYIERYYVEPKTDAELVESAITGMVRTLDPHSSFLTPDEYQMLNADTSGEFGGVGIEVGVKDNVITVLSPMPNSPASRAGIAPGDKLLTVDGQDTASMGIDETIRRMRGKVGTSVTATFLRIGETVPYKVELVREVIRVKSVEADALLSGFLWIHVQAFQDGTTAEVKQAIETYESERGELKGILLDLRRNPGGLLDEAVNLSDLFLKEGVIVSTRGRGDKSIDVYRAHRLGTISDIPMVVIIDDTSASAAEIVAGALQDQGRALLVGKKSFGKGSVQSIVDLPDGYGLKLTIARYFTPSGRSIQAEGIMPDIVVESGAPVSDTALEPSFKEADLPGHLSAVSDAQKASDMTKIEDNQLRVSLELLTGLARQKVTRER
jgi:carboxyl-terminal processing protease